MLIIQDHPRLQNPVRKKAYTSIYRVTPVCVIVDMSALVSAMIEC